MKTSSPAGGGKKGKLMTTFKSACSAVLSRLIMFPLNNSDFFLKIQISPSIQAAQVFFCTDTHLLFRCSFLGELKYPPVQSVYTFQACLTFLSDKDTQMVNEVFFSIENLTSH